MAARFVVEDEQRKWRADSVVLGSELVVGSASCKGRGIFPRAISLSAAIWRTRVAFALFNPVLRQGRLHRRSPA